MVLTLIVIINMILIRIVILPVVVGAQRHHQHPPLGLVRMEADAGRPWPTFGGELSLGGQGLLIWLFARGYK